MQSVFENVMSSDMEKVMRRIDPNRPSEKTFVQKINNKTNKQVDYNVYSIENAHTIDTYIQIALPGYGKENIKVSLEGETTVVVECAAVDQECPELRRYTQKNVSFEPLHLCIGLHPGSVPEGVTYTNGILTICVVYRLKFATNRTELEIA